MTTKLQTLDNDYRPQLEQQIDELQEAISRNAASHSLIFGTMQALTGLPPMATGNRADDKYNQELYKLANTELTNAFWAVDRISQNLRAAHESLQEQREALKAENNRAVVNPGGGLS